MISERRS